MAVKTVHMTDDGTGRYASSRSSDSDWSNEIEFVEKKRKQKVFSNSRVPLKQFETYFDYERPFSGTVSRELEELYEGSEVAIKSHVIVPMKTLEWEGILLLGSKDVERYKSNVEIDFLLHLRDILVLAAAPVLRNEGLNC